jgi:hypothetical protein
MPVPPLRHAVLLAALLSPALAAAQKPPPAVTAPAPPDRQIVARGLAQDGLKLFGADRFTEALATFREADALFHAPSVTLYIARCQRKLGKLLDARATYEQILAEPVAKEASPQFVQAHVEAGQEMEALKPKIPVFRATVTGAPASDVTMTLDGTPFDGSREVDPGPHTLEIRRRPPGPAEPPRTVTLAEGDRPTLTIDLGAPRVGLWYLPGAVTAGAGVVGLSVGAITGALALGKISDLKSRCPAYTCDASFQSEIDSAKLLGNVSTAAFVIGGAAVAAGGVLLFLQRPRPLTGQAGWGVRAGLGRLDVEGRF